MSKLYVVCLHEIRGSLHVVRLRRRMGCFSPVSLPMPSIPAHRVWLEMRRGGRP